MSSSQGRVGTVCGKLAAAANSVIATPYQGFHFPVQSTLIPAFSPLNRGGTSQSITNTYILQTMFRAQQNAFDDVVGELANTNEIS
jgi:hypothetical protein